MAAYTDQDRNNNVVRIWVGTKSSRIAARAAQMCRDRSVSYFHKISKKKLQPLRKSEAEYITHSVFISSGVTLAVIGCIFGHCVLYKKQTEPCASHTLNIKQAVERQLNALNLRKKRARRYARNTVTNKY